MLVETASYRGAISVYICDAHPLQKYWRPCGLAGLSGECHKVWLPPSAKGTDLLPALRTNPSPEVSSGMGSQRKKRGGGAKSEGKKQGLGNYSKNNLITGPGVLCQCEGSMFSLISAPGGIK